MANGGRGHACVQAAKVAEVPTAGCRREGECPETRGHLGDGGVQGQRAEAGSLRLLLDRPHAF